MSNDTRQKMDEIKIEERMEKKITLLVWNGRTFQSINDFFFHTTEFIQQTPNIQTEFTLKLFFSNFFTRIHSMQLLKIYIRIWMKKRTQRKYAPVTVRVTWIVSSPAVLFTQHRYLPLSSSLAYFITKSTFDHNPFFVHRVSVVFHWKCYDTFAVAVTIFNFQTI